VSNTDANIMVSMDDDDDINLVDPEFNKVCQGDCFYGFSSEEECRIHFAHDRLRTSTFEFISMFILPYSILVMLIVMPCFQLASWCFPGKPSDVNVLTQLNSDIKKFSRTSGAELTLTEVQKRTFKRRGSDLVREQESAENNIEMEVI
jgi:hypothetical protein